MRQKKFKVLENRFVSRDLFLMRLVGKTTGIYANGDFVNIAIPGTFLRRPISVFDVQDDVFTIVYKLVGKGTCALSEKKEGDVLDVLTGLGNGYDSARSGKKPLLVCGGYGAASLYGFTKSLALQGKNPHVLIGLNSSDDSFFASVFLSLEEMGARVQIVTVDGSLGKKGLVTDFIYSDNKRNYTFMYACGPIPMLQAISDKTDMPGQFSLEGRMGCGFGACMGCSVMTKNGPKRICKEGPVLDKEEILWTQASI